MHPQLALLGGEPVYAGEWPRWPEATAEQLAAVRAATESGQWSPTGLRRSLAATPDERFCAAWAHHVGTSHCATAASGSAALRLALEAQDVGWGDVVAIPDLTWIAVLEAVLSVGARPVLVEVDDTLTMGPEALARHTADHPVDAVVVVHANGAVAATEALAAAAGDRCTGIIEDASQAHGARDGARRVGSVGRSGVFSMHASKLLTSGEGGAFVTSDGALHERFCRLRTNGRTKVAEPVEGAMDHSPSGSTLGTNAVLGHLQSALLETQVGTVDARNDRIAAHVAALEGELAPLGCSVTGSRPGTTRVFSNVTIRWPDELLALAPVSRWLAALVAECGRVVKPLPAPLATVGREAIASRPSWRWFLSDPLAEQFALPPAPSTTDHGASHLLVPHQYVSEEWSTEVLAAAVAKVVDRAAALRTDREGNG